MLGEISLTPTQKTRAIATLKQLLKESNDWIVLPNTLETLAMFAGNDSRLRAWLIPVLKRYQKDPRKSVARHAGKVLAQLAT